MSQTKVRPKPPRESTATSAPTPPAPVDRAEAERMPPLPPLVRVITGGLIVGLTAVVLSMTPLTYQLDDIKQTIFLLTGPVLMLLSLAAMMRGEAPWPPRVAGWALAGFAATLVVSTVLSEFPWIGRPQTMIFWSAGGFFMAATVVGSHPRTTRLFARYLVLLLFATNVIGFFMFDFYGSNEHRSGVGWLYRMLYPDPAPRSFFGSLLAGLLRADSDAVKSLLWTLYGADTTMQSTILNRDFYAGFCLLLLPFAMLMALHPARSPYENYWRLLGMITTVLSIAAIFLCQSKGEYLVGAATIGGFMLVYLKVDFGSLRMQRKVVPWIVGVVILLGALAWMRSPTLLGQLKGITYSTTSRSIIWTGAVKIFRDHPILGGGPGTFRIYFPQYRARDYFNHEISNVTNYAHNYFLDLLAEEGIVGFACFMTFLLGLALPALRRVFVHPDHRMRMLLLAALTGLAGLLGSNLSSPSARWIINASTLWTVLGFLAGLNRQAEASEQPAARLAHAPLALGPTRRAGRVALVLAALIAIPFCWSFGIRYFQSNMQNAIGLNLMESTYEMISLNQLTRDQAVNRLTRSYQAFEEAIRLDPTNISPYYKLGSVYLNLAMLMREWASYYLKQNQPNDAATAVAAADGFLEMAKRRYEDVRKLWPDYAEIHYNMVITYREYADYLRRKIQAAAASGTPSPFSEDDVRRYEDLALWHVERMGRLSCKLEVLLQQGELYLEYGMPREAAAVFAEAAERYPASAEAAHQYLAAARAAGDPKLVAAALERLWRQSPGDDDVLRELLAVGWQSGQDDVLQRVLERLEAINPVHPALFEYRMKLADRRGDAPALASAYAAYLRVSPSGDRSLLWMGAEAARAIGDRALAKLGYERLIGLDGDEPTTYGQQAQARLADLSEGSPQPLPAGL